ncbi:MAG TPA: class I SAM-dependent methyltransferase [Actinomycetes bacterium]|nr:class I SAM-dependent methyltransferase [Actinomycetes bacterium]
MIALLERRPDAPGREALALYDGAPLAARAHVQIRWATCPLPGVAALVPDQGRILDVGCGHGLFSAYLALDSAERDVHGVDIDAAKIALAREAARRSGDAFTADVAPSGQLPAGPWDVITIVDVLYLLDADGQRDLLTACRALLAPGGILVVKEMGTTPRWKARLTLLQETMSVRVLRITEGASLTFVPPETVAGWLRNLGLEVQSLRLDRGRLHPHHVLIATDAPGAPRSRQVG